MEKGFDKGAPLRKKTKIKVWSVCLSIENENQIVVIEEAPNAQAAYDFLNILKSRQKEGNVLKLAVKI